MSDNKIPETPPTFTHHTPNTSLCPSVSPGMFTSSLLSDACTTSLTGSLLPSMGGRTPQTPYLHFSTFPLYQTSRSGCQMPPVAIAGMLMQQGHQLSKKCAAVSPLPSAPVLPYRYLFHQLCPLLYHCAHHHIKYSGVKRISLLHSLESFKSRPVVPPCTRYHL